MDTDIDPLNWHRLFFGLAPPMYLLEIVLRIIMLFAVLLLVVRLLGKRGQQNLSPMQQMLMIALGSAAGDVMLYPQIALIYSALVLVGVTLLTIALEKTAANIQSLQDYIESEPTVLVRHGRIDWEAMEKERTTERELYANLRSGGAVALSQVDVAILEVTGSINVVLNDSKPSERDLVEYLLQPDGAGPADRQDSHSKRTGLTPETQAVVSKVTPGTG